MLKDKGTIENGKMLTGYTNAGREIWKTIPQVTHTFQVGDRVSNQPYGYDDIEYGVVVDINDIGKKLPYEWNSVLEVRVLVEYPNRGQIAQYPQDYAMQVLKKL
jgi:hypothetical protein